MNGAECLLRTLVANGVDLCLANPGTSEMQFVSALDRVPGMRGVLCLYEGVCSGAADGYARMSNRAAATLLHLGPGLANGLSNFHNARKARSPIVSIIGEHATQHLRYDAPLSADTAAFARTISSAVQVLESAGQMGAAAAQVVRAAYGPPGQVSSLLIPADFSWSEAGSPGPVLARPTPPVPETARIEEARRLLAAGSRTAIFLSDRAMLEPGIAAAGRIASATGAKLFVNRFGARWSTGAGRFAACRIPYFPEMAEPMLRDCGHMILVEAEPPVSFFAYPNRSSLLAPESCHYFTLATIGEDGTAALEALADGLPPAPVLDFNPPAPPDRGELTPDSIGRAIAAYLPEGAIVSDEMVSASGDIVPHLIHSHPWEHLAVTGGAIGQGLPVALGAALSSPGRKVVALEADGSAMYSLQALWTMARESLDVVTVILANRRYQILDVEMKRTGAAVLGRQAESMIDISNPPLEWVPLARALGVPARQATTAEEFSRLFQRAVAEPGPCLIEALLPSGRPSPR
ncbi:MAG: acetolactate synthase large subunit [Bryobacterales bacterium]|nr:acetolactate synthase large subunit [Bryobacterales bacterium]